MEHEKRSQNGSNHSFFHKLKKLFQATWQESTVSKNPFDEENGKRGACPQCGSPVVRFRNMNGSRYCIGVTETMLMEYFQSRKDIDDFVADRLQRAERIIVQLRRELNDKGS